MEERKLLVIMGRTGVADSRGGLAYTVGLRKELKERDAKEMRGK